MILPSPIPAYVSTLKGGCIRYTYCTLYFWFHVREHMHIRAWIYPVYTVVDNPFKRRTIYGRECQPLINYRFLGSRIRSMVSNWYLFSVKWKVFLLHWTLLRKGKKTYFLYGVMLESTVHDIEKQGKGRWKRLIYIQNDITYHRMSHYSRKEEELDIYFFQSKHNIKADRQDWLLKPVSSIFYFWRDKCVSKFSSLSSIFMMYSSVCLNAPASWASTSIDMDCTTKYT